MAYDANNPNDVRHPLNPLSNLGNAGKAGGGGLLLVIILLLIFTSICGGGEERKQKLAGCISSFQSQNFDIALKCFGTYIDENDSKGEGYLWRGYTYLSLNKPQFAKEDFLHVIEQEEYATFGYQALGDMLIEENSFESRKNYAKSLDIDKENDLKPESAAAFLGIANTFIIEGNQELAYENIRKALRVSSYFYPLQKAAHKTELGDQYPIKNGYSLPDILNSVSEKLSTGELNSSQNYDQEINLLNNLVRCEQSQSVDCLVELIGQFSDSSLVMNSTLPVNALVYCEMILDENEDWESLKGKACWSGIGNSTSLLASTNTQLQSHILKLESNLDSGGELTSIGYRLDYSQLSTGLKVTEVAEGSPAASAGIKEGDFLIVVDGISYDGRLLGDEGSSGSFITIEIEGNGGRKMLDIQRDGTFYNNYLIEKIEHSLGKDNNIRSPLYRLMKAKIYAAQQDEMKALEELKIGIDLLKDVDCSKTKNGVVVCSHLENPLWDARQVGSDIYYELSTPISQAYQQKGALKILLQLYEERANILESLGKISESKEDKKAANSIRNDLDDFFTKYQESQASKTSIIEMLELD